MATRAERRRRGEGKPGVRNLTGGEQVKLLELVQPHLLAREEANQRISAICTGFLGALGFPPNCHIDLRNGVVTELPEAPPAEPVPAPNGVAKESPAVVGAPTV